jgi:hypothetical protein
MMPFFNHVGKIGSLIHDDGVRKFASESYNDFSTFEDLNEIRGEEEGEEDRNAGWTGWKSSVSCFRFKKSLRLPN